MLPLPSPTSKRLAVRVTRDAERHIRSGHPWIYDQSIESLSHEGVAGDLAVIFDKKRDFLAIGLFDPSSPIQIKVLHHGRPSQIDRNFWEERIGAAIAIREPLRLDPGTTAYRLINGENDALPGLVVDRYDTSLVIKLYSAAWFPHLVDVVMALTHLVHPDQIVLRLARNVARGETFHCYDGMVLQLTAPDSGAIPTLAEGTPTGPVDFLENGLRLEADLLRGQKTGHFLDQRDNRNRVTELAAGLQSAGSGGSALDVFSCTGGFSLSAAAGGATSVHAVDLAPMAIQNLIANFDRNLNLPLVEACRLSTTIGDAFEVMERLAKQDQRYDMVIIDPPSFAQKQEDISRAQRAYRRLTSLGLGVLAPGGVLVQSSCSSRLSAEKFFDGVQEAARLNGFHLNPFAHTEHGLDHPATFAQGHYLKTIYARPTLNHATRS